MKGEPNPLSPTPQSDSARSDLRHLSFALQPFEPDRGALNGLFCLQPQVQVPVAVLPFTTAVLTHEAELPNALVSRRWR